MFQNNKTVFASTLLPNLMFFLTKHNADSMPLINNSAHFTEPRRRWRSASWRRTQPSPGFSSTARNSAPRRWRPRRRAALGDSVEATGKNGQVLAAALKENRQVTKIFLKGNYIGDAGAKAWEVLAEFFFLISWMHAKSLMNYLKEKNPLFHTAGFSRNAPREPRNPID